MEHQNLKAKNDIPKLISWANKLISFSTIILQKQIIIRDNDHFGFMTILFIKKQIEHLKSILILIDNNQELDSVLIARSMIEGYSQLEYASKDKQQRAYRWRAFSWITDWRLARSEILSGHNVDEKQLNLINKSAKHISELFLRKNRSFIELQKNDKDIKDPFKNKWINENYSEIIQKLNRNIFYELYVPFSAWHHWCPSGIGKIIKLFSNKIIYNKAAPDQAASSIAIGMHCLLQTLEIFDFHFKLKIDQEITKFRNDCLVDLKVI
jgi:hypothetical protein